MSYTDWCKPRINLLCKHQVEINLRNLWFIRFDWILKIKTELNSSVGGRVQENLEAAFVMQISARPGKEHLIFFTLFSISLRV